MVNEVEITQKHFQEQIINYYIKSNEPVAANCLKFIRTLAHLQSGGSCYAKMISKIFGFKKMNNYTSIIQQFLQERERYMTFSTAAAKIE